MMDIMSNPATAVVTMLAPGKVIKFKSSGKLRKRINEQ